MGFSQSFHLGSLCTSLSHANSGDTTCSEQLESVWRRGTESDESKYTKSSSAAAVAVGAVEEGGGGGGGGIAPGFLPRVRGPGF